MKSYVQFSGYKSWKEPADAGYNHEAAGTDEVGVDWSEGPPVPIPNTEVKLRYVDDSCRVTGRENR